MPEQDDTQPRAPYHERRAAILADTSTSSARLRAAILAQFEEFERERRAEILAAGGNPDEDRDPFEAVRAIADNWADTADAPDRRAAMLDDLAASLRLRDIRALRLAAEAAAAVTPRMITEEADAGVRPAAIADKLGVTESYVYRVLREQRDAQQADTDAKWSAFYTVERWDVDHWWEEAAQSISTTDGPVTLARNLLDRAQPHYAGAKLRVQVWKFGESEGFPLATAVTGQE